MKFRQLAGKSFKKRKKEEGRNLKIQV